MAAAIGANLPVTEPIGNMIVDIGGGTSEIGIISIGSMVICKSIRLGGDALDQTIINHCKKYYNLLIGERTAEHIKIEIGSAYPLEKERNTEIRGRDLTTGMPRNLTLSSFEIRDTLSESIQTIIQTIHFLLDQCPPDLASDIFNNGITLTGGGSLLTGLSTRIHKETNLKVTIATDPLECVAAGTAKILSNKKLMEKIHTTIY